MLNVNPNVLRISNIWDVNNVGDSAILNVKAYSKERVDEPLAICCQQYKAPGTFVDAFPERHIAGIPFVGKVPSHVKLFQWDADS